MNDKTHNPLDCDCRSWAVTDHQASLCGNGHNPACEHFKPTVRAVELLAELVKGIKWWADQEDGVPDELWEAYEEAVFITSGRVVSRGPVRPNAGEGRQG